MGLQNGGWRGRWEAAAPLRTLGRAAVDLLLPPLAHDEAAATATLGLTPDAWSRIAFLEDPVCDGCGAAFEMDGGVYAETRCAGCQAESHVFSRARAACLYDEASRGMILRFKHGDHQPFAPLFARWLQRAADPLLAGVDAIVPTPLHPMRLLARRFNQAAEVARPLARATGLDYLPDALVRQVRTGSQGGRSARGRRMNVKGVFAVSEAGRRRIRGRRILLVDDVLTTGATANACARTLLDAGARSVDLAVIARVRTARELVT